MVSQSGRCCEHNLSLYDWLSLEYSLSNSNLPEEMKEFVDNPKQQQCRVGLTAYHSFFSEDELTSIESLCQEIQEKAEKNEFLPMTSQKTYQGNILSRTKHFFNARYLWTAKEMESANSHIANGIRTDVSPVPRELITLVEQPLVESGTCQSMLIHRSTHSFSFPCNRFSCKPICQCLCLEHVSQRKCGNSPTL